MMSNPKADHRVFSVAPEGSTAIEGADRSIEDVLPTLPKDCSPDEVIFLTHILSLKVAALVHLGVIKEQGEEVDIETAKQIIDTLEVLKKRTGGHLSFEEEKMFETSLKELKVAYLSVKP